MELEVVCAGSIGLVIALLLRLPLGAILGWTTRGLDGQQLPIPERLRSSWTAASQLPAEQVGKAIGRLEVILFYGAFWINAPTLAGGWLVFKVGSKWEVWANVVKIPDTLDDEMNSVEELHLRHWWGTRLLGRFLVGTLWNVIIAAVGVLAARVLLTQVWGS